jgi:serine phosphatase RsbU (regulator of sigma subunit)
VLVSVAFLAGQAVEYTEIHEELLELDRRNLELEVARDLQLAFLPQRAPRTPAYQFAHHYRAAQYVAGDYFDYIELPGGRVAVVVGDVAGHGVSAALTMARLCSEIRYSLVTTQSPAEAVSQLNWHLSARFPDLPFVTQVLCVLDHRSATMTIVNAGHPYPLLRRADSKEVESLAPVAGLPLGIRESTNYEQFTVTLNPGDLVLLFTDGVTEAMNRRGELYDVSRLSSAVARAGPEPKHVIRAVLNDVRMFCEGRPFHDDVCLVCLVRRDGL